MLIAAGAVAVLAAAIHGVAGEVLVVRKLSREALPATRLGGRGMTLAMIHVSWHIATAAFLVLGIGLLVAGSTLDGDAARAIGLVAAGAFTGFALVALALGFFYTKTPRTLYRHPGPVVLATAAVLAWLGSV
jgi:hypothetical protein